MFPPTPRYWILEHLNIFLAVLSLQCPTQTCLPPQESSILMNYYLVISFPLNLVIIFISLWTVTDLDFKNSTTFLELEGRDLRNM